MSDKIINFYNYVPRRFNIQYTENYKNHYIKPCSRIGLIGASGAGKTNALLNFLDRTSGDFYKIIICCFSTTNEPLYKMIKDKNEDIIFIDDPEDIPDLSEFDDRNKEKQKLIVFDDFIHLNRKAMEKINKYFISSRKYGFTTFALSQDFTSLPKIISRNINYYILFKINDNISLSHILRTHNISNIDKEEITKLYRSITSIPFHFLLIDLENTEHPFRHNFLDFI